MYVVALPFAEVERFAREVVHKLARERRGERFYSKEPTTTGGGCRDPVKTPPEKKEDTVGSVTMMNGAMPSNLMG
jgi:hypothetical protein